jgi:hypothetical protein
MHSDRPLNLLAHDAERHWSIGVLPDHTYQLDLRGVCLRLSLTELHTLTRLTVVAASSSRSVGLLSQATPDRFVHCCPHSDVWTLRFDRVTLRFRRYEFLSLTAICQKAAAALPDVRPDRCASLSAIADIPFSRN